MQLLEKINKYNANFGVAAATLLLLKVRLRNKTHNYLVHKEIAFFFLWESWWSL